MTANNARHDDEVKVGNVHYGSKTQFARTEASHPPVVLSERRDKVVNIHRTIFAGAVVIAAVGLLAGCGTVASSTTGVTSTNANSGSPDAAAFVAKYTANPTTIEFDVPLPSKPQEGISVIELSGVVPANLREAAAEGEAAKALGWQFSTIDVGSTATTAISAFEAAIAKKPNAIVYSGYPASQFAAQIKAAADAGIAVISASTDDAAGNGLTAVMFGNDQLATYGKLSSAYFAANASPGSRAAIFSVSAFPVLQGFTDGFNEGVKEWCSSCSTEVVDQQVSDLGTQVPGNVVSYLQRNPDVKWIAFSNGNFAQGVTAALKAAGITGVNIIGQGGDASNLANLANGSEASWVGYPLAISAWRIIDVLARHFEGADLSDATGVSLPTQILVQSNIAGAVVDNGFYDGVTGYQDQFKKLWHVS